MSVGRFHLLRGRKKPHSASRRSGRRGTPSTVVKTLFTGSLFACVYNWKRIVFYEAPSCTCTQKSDNQFKENNGVISISRLNIIIFKSFCLFALLQQGNAHSTTDHYWIMNILLRRFNVDSKKIGFLRKSDRNQMCKRAC